MDNLFLLSFWPLHPLCGDQLKGTQPRPHDTGGFQGVTQSTAHGWVGSWACAGRQQLIPGEVSHFQGHLQAGTAWPPPRQPGLTQGRLHLPPPPPPRSLLLSPGVALPSIKQQPGPDTAMPGPWAAPNWCAVATAANWAQGDSRQGDRAGSRGLAFCPRRSPVAGLAVAPRLGTPGTLPAPQPALSPSAPARPHVPPSTPQASLQSGGGSPHRPVQVLSPSLPPSCAGLRKAEPVFQSSPAPSSKRPHSFKGPPHPSSCRALAVGLSTHAHSTAGLPQHAARPPHLSVPSPPMASEESERPFKRTVLQKVPAKSDRC